MVKPVQQVYNEALALNVDDRTLLIAKLCDSLHDEMDPNIEVAWIEESKRRWAAYKRGETTAKPVDQAMREIRERLGRSR